MKAVQRVLIRPQQSDVESSAEKLDQLVSVAQMIAVVQCGDQRTQWPCGVSILNQQAARRNLALDPLHEFHHGGIVEMVGDAGDCHDVGSAPPFQRQIRKTCLDELSASSRVPASRDRQRRFMLIDADIVLRRNEVQHWRATTAQIEHRPMGTTCNFGGQQPVASRGPLARDRKLCCADKRPDPKQPSAKTLHRRVMLPPAILTA